ncbi:rho GTPase-activating protein 12-like [Daktulosphaira vitifoliae]|uniref:rho GTPase-activating protein 12-like n=1 Tax=Daktulosphaira vitifoliae TaxID=58002 RepID=UPI0021AB08C6|nr:rho GTPase-activating protein 12-like [Daktulosphaira vitifoliae]
MDIADIKVRVLYDFEYKTRENKCISIKEGEKLLLLKKTNNDWWQVIRSSGRPFYVPATFVKEIPRAPSRPSLSKNEEKIKFEKPQVLKRTIFEKPSTPSYENIPIENTNSHDESVEYENLVDDVISNIKRVDIQNENNILSPIRNRKNKTIVTLNQENSGYCQVNVKKCDSKQQLSLQLSSSLEELAQEIELKSMPLNKNSLGKNSLNAESYSKVQNLLGNIRKPSTVSSKNLTEIEKPSLEIQNSLHKNKLCYTGSFKTKHERDKWAKNIMTNSNIIEEHKPDDEESMTMMSDSIMSKSTSTPDAHSTSADLTGGSTDSLLDGDSIGITDSDQDSLRLHGSKKRTSLARNRRVESYTKRYPLRNSSPPVPDSSASHDQGEHVYGSWYKYSTDDGSGGSRPFYYNTKTYERTWSSPKRRCVVDDDKGNTSRHSSANALNSGSQSSSPLAELDVEYEPNDNCTPAPKTNAKKSINDAPVGWIMQADPSTGLPCFVNQSTGAKWFTSKDFEGRSYYFEENSNESSWNLPEASASSNNNTTTTNDQSPLTLSKLDLEDTSSSLLSNKSSRDKKDADSISPLSTPQCTAPRNWPQLWGGHMCILKEGPLSRTKITENGKRLRKHWTTSHVILTELFMLFFKDAKSFSAMKNGSGRPELSVDLNGALVYPADKVSSRKNVYVISTVLGTQVLFQDENNTQAQSWVSTIQAAISNLPSSFDACPRIPSARSNESPETEKSIKLNRNKSLKLKLKDGGSVEDLTSNNAERQTKIKARLRKFFHRRPTMESLVKKGIWKDEPAFGCFLEHVVGTEHPRIPAFVKRCINAIESSEENLKTDGLYRASGNLSQVQKIRLQVDQNNLSVIDQEEDVHVLTGALKLFFRELKEPLIPYHVLRKAISAGTNHSRKDKLLHFRDITKSLPAANYDTLKFLLKHLLKVTSYKEFNRMQIPNLAIVFGPTLMWPETESTNMAIDLMQQNMVIEALLVDFDNIFR